MPTGSWSQQLTTSFLLPLEERITRLINKEYKRVAWKVNERDNNVWIIHALAVRYEYRGMGLATQFVKNLISYAKLENIEAIHLDVIDKNTLADKLYIRAGFKYVSTENIFYEVVGNRQFRMYEYVIE